MENFINQRIKENFELLQLEGGHTITQEALQSANMIVKNYWLKLRRIAEKVTQAEVPLVLPEQITPEGRTFTLQGVVDVVTDDSGTMIYDIKTVDVNSVRANICFYKAQLSVYAYVWKKLKNKPLNGCAIIAVGLTGEIKKALKTNDQHLIDQAIKDWNPEVIIELDDESIDEAILNFGQIVDKIESHQFSPPHWSKLKGDYLHGIPKSFAKHVCHNCDIRYSCDSYQRYALEA